MYKIPFEELKSKLIESGKITSEELDSRIKNKINELSGLISQDGAAHIIANELGVSIAPPEGKKLTVREVHPGMRSVDMNVKVVQKYEVREFSRNDSSGKVGSMLVGDETGVVRLVFWNDHVDEFFVNISEGDTLAVSAAYSRENNGRTEVHMGRGATVDINPAGVEISGLRRQNTAEFSRKDIAELTDGEAFVELLGTVVQVFDPRFFEIDPATRKRVNLGPDNKFYNVDGKEVQPALSYVMNVVVDDGTGTIRNVLWKEQTNALLEMSEEDLAKCRDDMTLFEEAKTNLLGEQFVFKGRVKHNQMFDRLEFSVQQVEKAKAQDELEKAEALVEDFNE